MKRLALQPVELSWVRRHKPGEITCVKRFWLRLPWPLLAWVRRLALRPAGAPVALVVAVMAAADLVAATASEAVVSEAAATVLGLRPWSGRLRPRILWRLLRRLW